MTADLAGGSRRRLRLSAHHSDIGARGVSDPRGRGVAGSSGPNRGSLTPRLLRVIASERRRRTPPRRAVASLANSVARVTCAGRMALSCCVSRGCASGDVRELIAWEPVSSPVGPGTSQVQEARDLFVRVDKRLPGHCLPCCLSRDEWDGRRCSETAGQAHQGKSREAASASSKNSEPAAQLNRRCCLPGSALRSSCAQPRDPRVCRQRACAFADPLHALQASEQGPLESTMSSAQHR